MTTIPEPEDKRNVPCFRTEGETKETARVFIHCSMCDSRLMELFPSQEVATTQGYYCIECQVDMALEKLK